MRVEEAITELVRAVPLSPREVVAVLRLDFAELAVRDGIWDMIDIGRVEVTSDLRLGLLPEGAVTLGAPTR